MKKWMLISWLMVAGAAIGQDAMGEIVGTVVQQATNKALVGAHVFVIDQDRKYDAITGEDGRFRISAIPAGSYLLTINIEQDTMYGIEAKVPVDGYFQAGKITFIPSRSLTTIIVLRAKDEMKLEYGALPLKVLSSEEIAQSPVKFDTRALVTTLSSSIIVDNDGGLVFRGARKDDMIYMVDGMKSREIYNLPSAAIGQIAAYTGGIPAKYGDTLGGVVVVETKSYFDLYRQWKRLENKRKRDEEEALQH